MNRCADWPERLTAFINLRRELPFEWGANDCCTFCADWVMEATNEDPLAGLRGSWSDARSALRTLEELGGLRTAVAAKLGEPHSALLLAQRGDVALIEQGSQRGIGIVVGVHVAVLTEDGIGFCPLSEASAAWPV